MQKGYEIGDEVRVVRNVRNDGTYPGLDTGAFLVRRGSTGTVEVIGTYLEDQTIYGVFFWDERRLVGCREPELIDAHDPWTPSSFEFRDKVVAVKSLAVRGEVLVPPGQEGEVLEVLRDVDPKAQPEVAYHVRFPGRTLRVPESALTTPRETASRLSYQVSVEEES